jgi:capsular exopolysaccharide synthesis family protein
MAEREVSLRTQPSFEDEVSTAQIWTYVDVLRRRRWLLLGCAVAAIVGAWWMVRDRVPQYTADVLLQRHAEGSPLDVLAVRPTTNPEEILTQLEILRSRAVLSGVVRDLGLRLLVDIDASARTRSLVDAVVDESTPSGTYLIATISDEIVLQDVSGLPLASVGRDERIEGPGFRFQLLPGLDLSEPLLLSVLRLEEAIEVVRGQLSLEQVRGTGLIRVGITSPDPVFSAKAADGVAAAYQNHTARSARNAATRRREFVGDQLQQVADSAVLAHQALASYQERSNTINPQIESGALAEALMVAEGQFRQLRFEEGLLRNVLGTLQSGQDGDEGLRRIVVLGSELLPASAGMYERLQVLQAERSRLTVSRFGYTENGPGVEVLDSLISAAREEILAVTEQSLGVIRERLAASVTRVEELQTSVGDLPALATEFMQIQQRVDQVQTTFDLLAEKYYEAQIVEAVEAGNIEVVDAAVVPMDPDPSRTARTLFLALSMGILVGIAAALVVEHLDSATHDVADVERASGLKVVATIPEVRSSARAPNDMIVTAVNVATPGAEAFRMLHTTLRFTRAEQPPKVIQVVSAIQGEGKSTVSSNLSLAIAQQGERVLVVDCDLRRPTLHKYFGAPQTPGITDVLIKDVTLADASWEHPDFPLTFVGAGTLPPNPVELLGSAAFQGIIREASKTYDRVLLDTAPMLVVSDAGVMLELADGVIVSTMTDHTDRFALSKMIERLQEFQSPILGLVLNRARMARSAGRYGYGYGSYTT